jgi:enterochelin esterase family protein
VFAGVMAQSPSAWWEDERLADSAASSEKPSGRFYISVGTREVQAGVTHAPSGLVQNVSQLDSVRRLSDKLKSAGHAVHHAEFDGGHDPACWAVEFSSALTWLLV